MAKHASISPEEAADRLAIRELIEAYAHFADRRDAKGQMALFTPDTHFVVYMDAKDPTPSQELHSREALAPVFADLNQYAATMHLLGQTTILSLTGDRGTGETYCMPHHLTIDGKNRRLMIAALRYTDTFVKMDDSWLFAERKPNAYILYSTLFNGPKLSRPDQINSSRLFFRELNRFGITSAVDAGGGFQNYPDDYEVVNELHQKGDLSVRLAYNLYPQKAKQELPDFERWTKMTKPGEGDDFYRVNGAGEMLVASAADFEDMLQPRPDMAPVMESELKAVVRYLAENRWPFRMHATYNETISRALDVYEEVNREIPFEGLHWFFDHCETITDRNIERIKALGGGIAVQNRMAFQGEYFVERYGAKQAKRTPPIRRMLEMGVPVGAGTDATRVSSYNPFLSLYWLVTGKTIGGLSLYPEENRFDHAKALELYTVGSSWFSTEDGKKGSLAPGQLADFAVLSSDYFSIPEEEIKNLESLLTMVGGKVVYAAGEFSRMAPPELPVSPDWSPVKQYGGYAPAGSMAGTTACEAVPSHHCEHSSAQHRWVFGERGLWSLGCDCFAF